MREFRGLWYPEGDELTRHFKARAETEPFYRAECFHDAMRYVKHRRGAVECGAHVGAWSRELAERFDQVVAIEANPDTVECLRRNLERFPRAQVVSCALGSGHGCIEIGGRKRATIACGVGRGDGPIVDLRPLDDVPLPVDVDYLKVHVNGYELPVLRGAEQTIRRHRPVMTVVIKQALADYGARPEHIFEFMERAGYRVASRLKPYWVFVPA